jgi:sugar transferase (PEP-CTERM/EpsH1 system associated)
MRIAFVTPYVPSRIRVRPYYWLKALRARRHEVTLFTIVADDRDERALPEIQELCSRVLACRLERWRPVVNCLRAVLGGDALQRRYVWSPELARRIERELARTPHEVAHVEHLRGSCFADSIRGIPVVFDSVDSIGRLFRSSSRQAPTALTRWTSAFDLPRTERFERTMQRRFAAVLLASQLDREHLFGVSGASDGRVAVVPNPVDHEFFGPGNGPREPATLVFSGKMSYHANAAAAIDLLRRIMPIVWQARPEARVWIVGQAPSAEVAALARDSRVTVTGTVPDLRPYLRSATIAVCPMRYGTGLQNKVLEAMACETPVVASAEVAAALSVDPERDLLIAATDEDFARKIVLLLDDRLRREELGRRGRGYVIRHHDLETLGRQLESVYEDAIRGN